MVLHGTLEDNHIGIIGLPRVDNPAIPGNVSTAPTEPSPHQEEHVSQQGISATKPLCCNRKPDNPDTTTSAQSEREQTSLK
jgi:hypothetical protein